MSEAVIGVKSDKDKGGTWIGAKENLNKKWVPLLVRDIAEEGNQALIQMGGIGFGHHKVPYVELLSVQPTVKETIAIKTIEAPMQQPDLLADNLDMLEPLVEDPEPQSEDYGDLKKKDEKNLGFVADILETSSESAINSSQAELITESDEQADGKIDERRLVQIQQKYGAIFELFVNTLISLSKDKTSFFILDDIKNQFPELQETQIKKWLKELETDGFLRKEGRKARYTFM